MGVGFRQNTNYIPIQIKEISIVQCYASKQTPDVEEDDFYEKLNPEQARFVEVTLW